MTEEEMGFLGMWQRSRRELGPQIVTDEEMLSALELAAKECHSEYDAIFLELSILIKNPTGEEKEIASATRRMIRAMDELFELEQFLNHVKNRIGDHPGLSDR